MTSQQTFSAAARIDATDAEIEAANAALFAWASEMSEPRRPQDGRVCDCEDAPCCGCYDL